MDKQHFEQLVKGVREMKRHIAGKSVRGARTTELPAPDVRTIREAARISQSQFAKLIGVNLRTLQNWEQQRRLRRCMNRFGLSSGAPRRLRSVLAPCRRLSRPDQGPVRPVRAR